MRRKSCRCAVVAEPALIPGVRRIAVLRPNAVGDFIMALPALHALRRAYPHADITYIGKPWHADFLAKRPAPIDRVILMPPCPGVGAPLDAPIDVPFDAEALQSFLDRMRSMEFDLALQLYGGGRHANPLIKRFGARITVGMRTPDAEPLDRWIPYGPLQNRRLQMLAVAALVGADTLRVGPELCVTARDRQSAQAVIGAEQGRRLIVLQPGATDRRRCWSPERFAAVADCLARQGAMIAINGSASEAPLTAQVREAMRHPALDLAGRLSLSGLCGLLERADLLIANDTGPLHLALAIGTPCVGIYWFTNLIESAPLRQQAWRAVVSAQTVCPACGAENLKTRCAHDVSFVDDVSMEDVLASAEELLMSAGRAHERSRRVHEGRPDPKGNDAALGSPAPSAGYRQR
jgi:ADP-heptose:LPS heptosyltransferase